MNKWMRWLILICIGLSACQPAPATPASKAGAEWLPVDPDQNAFARAQSAREFSFPADHGAHPEYQTEWWYFTGNLRDAGGAQFGYELTFFRRGLTPTSVKRESAWAAQNIYMAHFAITDGSGNRFFADQRFSRDGLDLAGAVADPLASIWLEDWSARQSAQDRWKMTASNGQMSLALDLVDKTGPVLQGDHGLSRKSAQNASYYYSLPRLESTGTISLNGTAYSVQGTSWMDHEFSTSALAADQIGWDWLALRLDDGSSLMLFQLRKADGSLDPFSSGTWIAADGSTTELRAADFQLQATSSWTSPHSGAKYPSGWKISIHSRQVELTVQPLIQDQELNLSFIYWEGAVRLSGTRNGQPIHGDGYVELTGYARSMQGEF
jgi:predicted secreted hydrolase